MFVRGRIMSQVLGKAFTGTFCTFRYSGGVTRVSEKHADKSMWECFGGEEHDIGMTPVKVGNPHAVNAYLCFSQLLSLAVPLWAFCCREKNGLHVCLLGRVTYKFTVNDRHLLWFHPCQYLKFFLGDVKNWFSSLLILPVGCLHEAEYV